jgi:hypothetical protein
MDPGFQSALPGEWVHSHEEDSGGRMVFRPATHDFPPSRGRQRFTLNPDGTLILTRPGPTDRRESTGGSWALEDGGVLVLHTAGGETIRYSILSADSDSLVLSRN